MFAQQHVEEIPAVGNVGGRLEPNVRRVHSAVSRQARRAQALADNACVLKVVADECFDLRLPFVGINRLRTALSDVARAVEFRRVTTRPKLFERNALARGRGARQAVGNDDVAATRAREARRLAEGAELNRNVACAVNFVNGARHVVFGYVGGIGGVEQNHGVAVLGVGNPIGQRGAIERRTRRIVRRTQINHVDLSSGRRRRKIILGGARQISHAREVSVALQIARPARHDVRVEINGIHGVGDCNFAVERENFLNVAAVALRAVADKNFVGVDLKPATFVVEVGNFFAQEAVALFGTVAAKSFDVTHFVSGAFHCVDTNLRQGARHVADTEPNDFRVGIFRLEFRGALADFGEQVAARQFQIIFVDLRHADKNLLKLKIAVQVTHTTILQPPAKGEIFSLWRSREDSNLRALSSLTI